MVGCASTPDKLDVDCVAIARAPLDLPALHTLGMDRIHWIVVTENNATKVLSDLKTKDSDAVVYAIDEDNYKSLAIDNKRVYFYILELQKQIDSYKEYYEPKIPEK